MRDRADLEGAAQRAGLTIRQIETLPDGTIASRMVFEDPWAAARLLAELTDQDADDPVVRGWALEILGAVADALGESDAGPTLSPELLAAFVRALHYNVQTQIRFRHEKKETFQSARETMRVGAGDCDDHARLLIALARSAGVDAQLVFFDEDDQPSHAVGLLRDASGWWWAETTIDARFGEAPLDALGRLQGEGVDLGANPFEQGAVQGIGSAPWGFVTAGDVRTRKDELNATVESLDADVVHCAALDGATLGAWNEFVASWRTFYGDDPSWWDAGAQGRQAGDYADQILDWQNRLAAVCKLSAPKLPAQAGPQDLYSVVKVVAIAGAVVAGAFALRDVTRILPSARRTA
jgi:hypothetical protein